MKIKEDRIVSVKFPIVETIRIRKNSSGLDYLLTPKDVGYFIIAVDTIGGACGQMMYWDDTEINSHFQQVISNMNA